MTKLAQQPTTAQQPAQETMPETMPAKKPTTTQQSNPAQPPSPPQLSASPQPPSAQARLSEVRRVGRERTPELVATMLAAFAEDPFSMWLFAGWDKKIIAKKKEDYWAWICKSFPADGEIHAVGDLSGAALWYWHPEQRYVATQAATSTDVATTDIDPNTPEGFQKFLKGLPEEHHAPRLDVFNRCYEAMPREACWYLGAVGVMPNRQGQGLGSALLASMLKRCDRQGLPAYLESSNPDNVSFYARLGFKPFGEAIPVPDSKTPPLIPMLRLPNMAEGNAGAVARGL